MRNFQIERVTFKKEHGKAGLKCIVCAPVRDPVVGSLIKLTCPGTEHGWLVAEKWPRNDRHTDGTCQLEIVKKNIHKKQMCVNEEQINISEKNGNFFRKIKKNSDPK